LYLSAVTRCSGFATKFVRVKLGAKQMKMDVMSKEAVEKCEKMDMLIKVQQ